MTVQVNFGPAQMKALPFTCRMVQEASAADAKADAAPSGKSTVVFPVGLPDEGTFDVVDAFMERNPSFTELSDRKVQEWAIKRLWRGSRKGWSSSNDKPSFDFGLPMLDDLSACKVISSVAPCVARNVAASQRCCWFGGYRRSDVLF
ncbi:unnamed protein product [Prorocentrum cordatum]|uniref:Uncharacterized protein n=1 Tax=Prorocentrum cordatum TaxID=2364126 RepID=A0ABN9PMM6_9DINO|nr:unnamed protein product [Polarella glacialis]